MWSTTSKQTDAHILEAIRSAIHEIWRDYAQYSQSAVSLKLLIATYSTDHQRKIRVVGDTAIREGRFVEAVGIGDAFFRSIADRYLATFTRLTSWIEAFMVFAMQQTKQSVPGCGGATRVLTMKANGELVWKNPYEIAAIQEFFRDVEHTVSNFILAADVDQEMEQATMTFIRAVNRDLLKSRKKLLKEIERIRCDRPSWLSPDSF